MCPESEEKYQDEVTRNRMNNINIYTTIKDKFLVFRSFSQEEIVQMRSEREKYKVNIISYMM